MVADEKTREAVIIDPGGEAEKIFRAAKENNLKPKFILLTHKHPDHTGALEEIEQLCNLRGCTHTVENGDELKLENLKIKAISTPGHTPDSVCFVAGRNIFSGDTLFKGGIGRTDLEGGDFVQIQKSLKRLMQFPDNFKVWPGHGEETTIGEEKKNNPFLVF